MIPQTCLSRSPCFCVYSRPPDSVMHTIGVKGELSVCLFLQVSIDMSRGLRYTLNWQRNKPTAT